VRDQWKKAAPAIEAYSKYLQTLPIVRLGSGRYVPQDPERLYKAINSACQGTGRDVLMERVIEISKRYDQYLLMTFHDEILLDVPVTELQEVVTFVRGVMESGYAGIPTPTDIEIFPTCWGGQGMSLDDYLKEYHG
jgi:DNA polymerase I-like protein with 3'-5' exonuclease and polymerase domains